MLTVEQIGTIMKELLLDRPPSLRTPEADQFREEVKVDLAEMKQQGIAPDIPYDFD